MASSTSPATTRGATRATDLGEHAPTLPCDDGIDNDGDGLIDYPNDPGCAGPSGPTELPEPSGWLMLIAGTGFLSALYRRRR